jgi:SAM-dependent methyltransferase
LVKERTINATAYEQRQQFNIVTSWLHSFRYRYVRGVFQQLAQEICDRPIRVIDIGCGYAKLFAVMNPEFRIEYTGIELNDERVAVARERYVRHENFSILHDSATEALGHIPEGSVDLIVALETLEHIPEHEVVRIVERIAEIRPKRFVCSVPLEIGPAIWLKNVGSFLTGYVRHREYTWRETFWAGLYRLDRLPPHGTGHKGFDWRWLAQTVRHNLDVKAIHRLPLAVLPSAFSTNVFLVAAPRRGSPHAAERPYDDDVADVTTVEASTSAHPEPASDGCEIAGGIGR